MSVRRPRQFVTLVVVLALVGLVGLVALARLTVTTGVVLVVVATLVAAEATAPTYVRPLWRRRLRLALLAALMAFTVAVGQRALALWPQGL